MSFTNAFETSLLQHLFQNAAIANVGDVAGLPGSTGAGSTQLSLQSVALTDASTLMTANELAYTGYSRQTQARSAAGWDVSGDTASNAALIQFGNMTAGGPVTAVHMGLRFLSTGDNLDMHADLNADLIINNGINPQYAIGALDWTLD